MGRPLRQGCRERTRLGVMVQGTYPHNTSVSPPHSLPQGTPDTRTEDGTSTADYWSPVSCYQCFFFFFTLADLSAWRLGSHFGSAGSSACLYGRAPELQTSSDWICLEEPLLLLLLLLPLLTPSLKMS